jgi:hypothetical protein
MLSRSATCRMATDLGELSTSTTVGIDRPAYRSSCTFTAVVSMRAIRSVGRGRSYAELPGAHHDFDLFESIRSAEVNVAVESFITRTTEQ